MAKRHETYQLVVNESTPHLEWQIGVKGQGVHYVVNYKGSLAVLAIYGTFLEIANFSHLALAKPSSEIRLNTGSATQYRVRMDSNKDWVLATEYENTVVDYIVQNSCYKTWVVIRTSDRKMVAKFIQSEPGKKEGGSFTFLQHISQGTCQFLMMLMCHVFTCHYKDILDIRNDPHLFPHPY